MTQKRFKKLLMSQGFQRNSANKKAAYYRSLKISYQQAFEIDGHLPEQLEKVLGGFASALKNFLSNACDAIGNVFIEMGKSLQEEQ